MQKSMEAKQQECPNCQAVVPVHAGYVSWCDQCGWNVNPQKPEKPRNVIEAIYSSLGQKQSQAILGRLMRAELEKPAFSLSRFLAFVLSLIIHGATLVLAVSGITLLVTGWRNPVAIFGGLLCLAMAWILRPRFSKLQDGILPRQEFPKLYKLVDAVAASLGAAKVYGVVVNEHFNAAFGQVGWQRRPVLYLGLPLWTILDGQEKLALVAHELAHSVNGDPSRGFFIGSAINTLKHWYALLRPGSIWPSDSGVQGLLMIPFNLVMLGLSSLAWLGAYGLSHLLFRDAQRAEYLADYLAASVSGTDAMLSLLEKLHFNRVCASALHSISLSRDRSRDLFEELSQRMAEVPHRELERVKRVQQLEASRLDTTHPPTVYRTRLLRAKYISSPKIEFAPSDLEGLEHELIATRKKVQQRLIDLHRAGLYAR